MSIARAVPETRLGWNALASPLVTGVSATYGALDGLEWTSLRKLWP